MIIITGGEQSLALPTEGLQEVPTLGIYSSLRRSISGRLISTISQFVTNERAYQLLLTREQMISLRQFAATVSPPFSLVDSEGFTWAIETGSDDDLHAYSTGAYFSAGQRFTGQPQQANGFACGNFWQMQVTFQVNARGWRNNSVGGGSVGNLTAEVPSGAITGANVTFGLAEVPTTLLLFRNGILQQPAVDYNLSGSTIVFTVGNAPQVGDSLVAYVGVV